MTCQACVKRISNALRQIDTIEIFDVQLGPPGSARIVCKGGESDVGAVSAAAIEAIQDTGFGAKPLASEGPGSE